MKITKSQLKQIIKEELGIFEYVEPQKGETTPDDAEVLVKGFGVLTIGQIKRRLKVKLDKPEKSKEYRAIVKAYRDTLRKHNALEGL
jgi:hypothetical protein